jgi:hypothetical protein
MLCSVLLDGNNLLYSSVIPGWEKDGYSEINSSPYGESAPDNIPELYTQQSRKIILHYNGEFVDGMHVAAGDRFGTVNVVNEPMFIFNMDTSDKTGSIVKPEHVYSTVAGWKEYKSIISNGSKINPARWIKYLFEKDIIPIDMNIPFMISDIVYGNKSCCVDGFVSTRIALNKKYFLDSLEIAKASKEIDNIENISSVLRAFGKRIDYAYGEKKEEKKKGKNSKHVGTGDRLAEIYEMSAGKLVEQLLLDKVNDIDELHRKEIHIAEMVAEQVLEEINIVDFIGHGDQSIGKAENGFRRDIYEIRKKLSLAKGGENNE